MNILKKIKNFFIKTIKLSSNSNNFNNYTPVIVARPDHNISRKKINKNVLKVLYRLKDNGYKSYLVGGGVRDLLLNRQPKDFDVATNAYPEKIKKLFKHCYIVGRRFQLAHVHFGTEVVEVATFRAGHIHRKHHSEEGMILRDNIYGNIEQDAIRRDFTINALYYNIIDYTLIDYVGGLKDLYAKQLCLIGDPITRYREDPVRMLRAIRFAAKLEFSIETNTAQPIYSLKELLLNIAPARLYDEYVKLFFYGHALKSFKLLKEYRLLEILFPHYSQNRPTKQYNNNFIIQGLKDVDNKIINHQQLNPAWVVAILLWSEVRVVAAEYAATEKTSEFLAYKYAAEKLLSEQNKIICLSKKLVIFIKDIWTLQIKLAKIAGKTANRANKLSSSSKFDVAFEFLLLREAVGDKRAQKTARWWKKHLATAAIQPLSTNGEDDLDGAQSIEQQVAVISISTSEGGQEGACN